MANKSVSAEIGAQYTLSFLTEKLSVLDPVSMPKTAAWAERLLALPEVRDSVVGEFEDLYLAAMRRNGSFSLQRLAA